MTDLGPSGQTETLLSDYRAPAWRIVHAELVFELDAEATQVLARLHLQADPAQPGAALVLDGEDLELLSIALDGQPLDASRYRHDAHHLRIDAAPATCVLETRCRIHPARNTRLEGLYRSGESLLTQCEAQGFRRIAYFIDRPDVMPTWRITLRGDKARYPVLLANGNPLAQAYLADGRHEAVWENPHPTPCYLFALVAGRLQCVRKDVRTADGCAVALQVWAAPHDVGRCAYALGAVERALRWDEQRFGRCYDLSVFNVVAAQDFTMGAMENKGLNIFNARYILADEATATDADYQGIESVIGHEYFHNWSGNRVTLRDWFQLALKEGLTVFRDQEFVADLQSRQVKRIEDVRLLRARQFAEDAGALAHPVRPDRYREINNFYTLTVYEKGAEIVRMLHTLLGEATFRAGMDQYFSEHDGHAATLEDFLAAHAAASGRDLSQFARWYAQVGTPELDIADDFVDGRYTLRIAQRQRDANAAPLLIPLRFALYDEHGAPIHATPTASDAAVREGVIELTAPAHTLVFAGLSARPLPSFNQSLSAPVKLHYDYAPAQLARLARCERDGLGRWDMLQRLATGVLLRQFDAHAEALGALSATLGDLLDDAHADPAFVAECMALPDFDTLADAQARVDIAGLLAARKALLLDLARKHETRLRQRHAALATRAAGGLDGAAMGARRLRNACLSWLTELYPEARLASAQFDAATRMTDRLAALRCLVHADAPAAARAQEAFAQRHEHDPLSTDKWLAVVATRPHADAVEAVRALLDSRWWTPTNPNRVRAILGSFSRMNPTAFHRANGAGYALLIEQLPLLDRINPQVAARLLAGFESWRRWDGGHDALAREHLERLHGKLASRDANDLLGRLLAARAA
ncbi:MAG: aminopeptidase N [Proteobacteria bacterium]|nr:aminopeptidase N [Pseudomonadota bacterium]